MTDRERLGLFQGIFSVILLALASTSAKFLLEYISPELLVLLGEGLSIVTIFLLFGLAPEFKKIFKFKKKTLIALFCSSVLTGALIPFFFMKGLLMTTATDAVMIASMSGIVTGIFASIFLKEKISLEKILGTIFMFSGVAIIATKGFDNGIHFGPGYYFLFASILAVSVATIIFKKFLTHISTDIAVLSRNFWGVLLMLFIFPLFLDLDFSFDAILNDQKLLLIIIGYGVFILLTAHLFWYKSLEKIKASMSSLLIFLKPLFGVIFAVLILKEGFDRFHLIGGILIVTGLIFSMYHRKKHEQIDEHFHKKHHWIPHWLHF